MIEDERCHSPGEVEGLRAERDALAAECERLRVRAMWADFLAAFVDYEHGRGISDHAWDVAQFGPDADLPPGEWSDLRAALSTKEETDG